MERTSGRLRSFRFGTDVWALEPKSAFYDWLYLRALSGRADLCGEVIRYRGFTDIEFNPEKSINCQTRSVALFVGLSSRGIINEALKGHESFLSVLARFDPLITDRPSQGRLVSEGRSSEDQQAAQQNDDTG